MKIGIVFLGFIALLALASCGTEDNSNDTAQAVQNDSSIVAVDSEVTTTVELASGFSNYDNSLIGEREDTVLFFHQESCGTCKATEKSLIEDGVPENLQVLKIDIDADSSVELKKQYGVTMKHTFVQIDADGNLIKKWNGSLNADDIVNQLEHSDAMMEKEQEDSMMEGEIESTVELSGTYADYDESLVGVSDNTVVFFHASWCPSCRAADSAISAETIPDGLTVLKADFDSETELRKKYGVVGQHTFVQIDSDGNEIKKWVGGSDIESIVEKI